MCTAIDWKNILALTGLLGTVIGVIAYLHAWAGARAGHTYSADVPAALQISLADHAKGFRQTQDLLGQILERMDTRADERHQEALELIATLKR